jgi:hypothetical protein
VGLTDLEISNLSNHELLDNIVEESSEVIQAVCKLRKFGAQSHHPDRTTTNTEDLLAEYEQVRAAMIEFCRRSGAAYGIQMTAFAESRNN